MRANLPPVFDIYFYWSVVTPVSLHPVYGHFHATVAELSSCDKDCMNPKLKIFIRPFPGKKKKKSANCSGDSSVPKPSGSNHRHRHCFYSKTKCSLRPSHLMPTMLDMQLCFLEGKREGHEIDSHCHLPRSLQVTKLQTRERSRWYSVHLGEIQTEAQTCDHTASS